MAGKSINRCHEGDAGAGTTTGSTAAPLFTATGTRRLPSPSHQTHAGAFRPIGPPKNTLLLEKPPPPANTKSSRCLPDRHGRCQTSAPTRKPAMQMPVEKAPPAPSSSSPARAEEMKRRGDASRAFAPVSLQKTGFFGTANAHKEPQAGVRICSAASSRGDGAGRGFWASLWYFLGKRRGLATRPVLGRGWRALRSSPAWKNPPHTENAALTPPLCTPRVTPAPRHRFRDPLGPTGPGNEGERHRPQQRMGFWGRRSRF